MRRRGPWLRVAFTCGGRGFVGISGRLGSLNRSRFFIEEFHEVDLLDPRVRGYHGLTETQLQTAGRSG